MDTILTLGDGSLIKGILILPFALNGLYLMYRGFIANLEKLDEKHPRGKNWQASAYFVWYLLSYLALVQSITKFH